MSDDRRKDQPMIIARKIRQTVMPSYEYQKPQYGFGSISVEDIPDGHGGVKQRIKTYVELGRGEKAVRHATVKVLPYEYQKPQYGFCSISVEDIPDGHGGVKQRIKTYVEFAGNEKVERHATDKVLPASGT